FFSCYAARRELPSFPTRRSSDLGTSQAAHNERGCGVGKVGGFGKAGTCREGQGKGRGYSITRAVGINDNDLAAMVKAMYRKVQRDRKSTRLNSSHLVISYAVFCL